MTAVTRLVPAQPPAEEPGTIVEEATRLSRSMIWRLNRQFFEERGLAAWSSGAVPSYVTSNPYIAQAYAHVVLAYLRDALAAGALDPGRPTYIIELASGSGRFAFLFLKKLMALKQASSLRHLDVRLVMTDFTPTNLRAWDEQPLFRPFFDAGVLDVGLFDVTSAESIKLEKSGTVLAPGTVGNPIVVLANYAFDVLPQDLFRVENGALEEVLVTSRHPGREPPDVSKPEVMTRFSTEYSYRPVTGAYYGDPELDRVLAYYRERLASSTVGLPVGALRGLRRLIELSGRRLLVLASDKAYTHEDELFYLPDQPVAFHGGSFSMMANFHAVGRYFAGLGGEYLATSQRHLSLKTVAFVLGADDRYADTRLAFQERVEAFGPCDFYTLLARARKDSPTLSFAHFLTLLRLSHFDPYVVHEFVKDILPQVQKAPEAQRLELRVSLERVWDNFYPMGRDLAFELGRLHLALELPREAARYCQASIDAFGAHAVTLTNQGIAHYLSDDLAAALRCFERSMELDPAYGLPRYWGARVRAESERLAT